MYSTESLGAYGDLLLRKLLIRGSDAVAVSSPCCTRIERASSEFKLNRITPTTRILRFRPSCPGTTRLGAIPPPYHGVMVRLAVGVAVAGGPWRGATTARRRGPP